jgi:hypothetical protein
VDAKTMAARAREITAGMPAPLDEIVFVASSPVYGLRFYTGVPIERARLEVDADPSPEPDDPTPSVCEEARAQEHRLWLVPAGRAAEFEREAQSCGMTARPLPPLSSALHAYDLTHGGAKIAESG